MPFTTIAEVAAWAEENGGESGLSEALADGRFGQTNDPIVRGVATAQGRSRMARAPDCCLGSDLPIRA